MAFDISNLAVADEADMEVLDLDGNGTTWIWTFAGPGHPATIEADRQQSQRFLNREAEKERSQVNGRKWKGDQPKVDERRAESIAYIVSRLLRWSDMTMSGHAYPFTPANAAAVLGNPAMPTLIEQANAFLLADKSFMPRSPKA
jgi:hypothetical protein